MTDDDRESMVGEGMLTVEEACRFAGVGRTFLNEMMDDGRLRTCKLGRRRLVPKAELIRLLAESLAAAK